MRPIVHARSSGIGNYHRVLIKSPRVKRSVNLKAKFRERFVVNERGEINIIITDNNVYLFKKNCRITYYYQNYEYGVRIFFWSKFYDFLRDTIIS